MGHVPNATTRTVQPGCSLPGEMLRALPHLLDYSRTIRVSPHLVDYSRTDTWWTILELLLDYSRTIRVERYGVAPPSENHTTLVDYSGTYKSRICVRISNELWLYFKTDMYSWYMEICCYGVKRYRRLHSLAQFKIFYQVHSFNYRYMCLTTWVEHCELNVFCKV